MPLYEYECQKCGKTKEVRHGIKDKPSVKCSRSNCNERIMVKQLGTFGGFQLKGAGFYRNDYPKGT